MNPFKHLLTKLKYLVNEDAKIEGEEKRDFQWSLLFTRGPVTFLIGKGGLNTIFYDIGGKRELCYPKEAIKLLEKKSLDKYIAYAIYSKDKELVSGPFLFHDDTMALQAGKGQFFVGIKSSGKLVQLYTAKSNLFGKLAWSPVSNKT